MSFIHLFIHIFRKHPPTSFSVSGIILYIKEKQKNWTEIIRETQALCKEKENNQN